MLDMISQYDTILTVVFKLIALLVGILIILGFFVWWGMARAIAGSRRLEKSDYSLSFIFKLWGIAATWIVVGLTFVGIVIFLIFYKLGLRDFAFIFSYTYLGFNTHAISRYFNIMWDKKIEFEKLNFGFAMRFGMKNLNKLGKMPFLIGVFLLFIGLVLSHYKFFNFYIIGGAIINLLLILDALTNYGKVQIIGRPTKVNVETIYGNYENLILYQTTGSDYRFISSENDGTEIIIPISNVKKIVSISEESNNNGSL